MPHDKNGVALKPGDRVRMEFVVRDVYEGTEMCNVMLTRQRDGEQSVMVTCQAKQCEKLADDSQE